MRRLLTHFGLSVFALLLSISVMAQQTTVSGSVKNGKTKEFLSAVSISVKGGTAGTYTDDKGNFKFSTVQKLPFTLVISSVGYAAKEVVVKDNNQDIVVELETAFTLGDEIVVSASRVPERILESPVSIERIGPAAIRNAPAANYYDMIATLKGVDVVTASLTFTSVGTRGFNSSGNTRLNQIVDGMDNQSPGLNFSVGNIIGLTELDVENMELLQGASSALYGPGGTNGTLLINSKNPFKYQGLSFQIKSGINHVDNKQRPRSPYYDWSVRFAKKINEKWAYKMNLQFVQAQDWLANNNGNYLRSPLSASPNGNVIPGNRLTDPNYDGVNTYGDETNADLRSAFAGVIAGNPFLALLPAGTFPGITTPTPIPSSAVLGTFANSPLYVSRTGYDESQVVNPTTLNVKLSGALHYKISDKIEAIVAGYWGMGNTVYTGSDRYSLKDLKMGQYKFELKAKNWYVRAYTTRENSGGSFNSTIATRLFNEAWKPSATQWYPQFVGATVGSASSGAIGTYIAALAGGYAAGLGAGLSPTAALTAAQTAAPGVVAANRMNILNAARNVADQGRPGGFIGNNPLFQQIANTPISQGGGLFVDRTTLKSLEAQYNLSDDLGLTEKGTDLMIGGNIRQFGLNSQGTLFADTAGNINITETGAYLQISQKMFGDRLKITASGRYDKNTNFKGRFTPRVSAVIKLAQDHNLRFSYQTAYRFPTTQNQWINLLVGGGTRLMGGLPQLRDFYNFNGNPAYTLASVQAFGASALAGAPNPGLLQQQQFGEFKPESTTSFEVGYKGLIGKRLLIDVYAYTARYRDFLSGVTVIQARAGLPPSPLNLLNANTRIAYSISTNAPGSVDVKGWGASMEYLMPKNFSVNANLYSDVIGELPAGFVSYFNTPKYRFNAGFSNSGFGKDNRYGFNVTYRWVDSFNYEGTFAVGQVPSYSTVDAMVSYKIPSIKSLIKVGGTNIFNKYYYNGFGNVQIGGLYYVSFGWNVF
ncbi:TonB-dependent receptor [Sediminibacterium sp. C3]|uniref:TonB-dependent receptor n=1 Tax=Sediminibacterium sp. C3 TaxID=1267211 RepID=UPI00042492E9|nr:TonB-dependent receptor [Sediminibacterium sp. C3]